MRRIAYEKGLHEIGDGIQTYLQPDGGYGWANAGLISDDGVSLLVDTLFDLAHTREMLDAMAPIVGDNPIESLINTHGDGDHCWGNQLVPAEARIYATSAAAADMEALPPQAIGQMLAASPDDYTRELFDPFEFEDIELRLPDETVDARRTFEVGDREIELIPLGPAHTLGDAIVHVPDAGVVFTGDILFIEGTPVTWHGPLSSWLRTIDEVLALDAKVLVPGHGPVTDAAGVADLQRYLRYVDGEARARHAAGMDFASAVDDIELGEFADWPYAERIVANVDTVYRDLRPEDPPRQRLDLLVMMSAYAKRHGLGG